MAVKPVDRIRTMITDLERGARTLGDDIRKRAGNTVSGDLESVLRQLMQGLTAIAAQLEKAAGELRRYLEAGARGRKVRKPARRAAATGKAAPKKKTAAKAGGGKTAGRKAASRKAPARKAAR